LIELGEAARSAAYPLIRADTAFRGYAHSKISIHFV
jgi:hypothetical protein